MANNALRRALAERRMTTGDLAERVGADPKTVARWVAEEHRTPHPRHRWAVADALEVDEALIWPQAVRSSVKTGPDREIVSAYTSRSAVPQAPWHHPIGYTSYFLWVESRGLQGMLRDKAGAGCSVRFLLGDPDSDVTRRREEIEGVALTIRTRIAVTLGELERLRAEAPSIEARFSDRHISLSVFQFDDQSLICQHLAAGLGHDSPTLHLRRRQDDGLFDRFAAHTEALWQAATPVWPPPAL